MAGKFDFITTGFGLAAPYPSRLILYFAPVGRAHIDLFREQYSWLPTRLIRGG